MRNDAGLHRLLLPILSLFISISMVSCYSNEAKGPALEDGVVERMQEYTTSKQYPGKYGDESIAVWHKEMPDVEEVMITSTIDGKKEPALFYASKTNQKKPLLVVLHSWSSGYLQQVSIPYAKWAKAEGWAFIHPNFRGKFDHPEAMASDVAVQDIVDAVNYARGSADIDTTRIYLVGSSGGAMTALVTASRHPKIWAGVVAWVPVLDLKDWFEFNKRYPHRQYNNQIMASAGGEPVLGSKVMEELRHRSPSTYLENAADVPIFFVHGINDPLVPPSHSMRAFNMLAKPEDQITQEQMDHIDNNQELPQELQGIYKDPYFGEADPPVVFVRESGKVKLVLYKGVHDMAYNPSLLWLNEQKRR